MSNVQLMNTYMAIHTMRCRKRQVTEAVFNWCSLSAANAKTFRKAY